MSEFKTIQWGIALVQGNKKDVDIFSDNIKQLKAENEKLKQQLKDANECIDSIYNIDAKYIDVPDHDYRDYYLDILDLIDKYKDEE